MQLLMFKSRFYKFWVTAREQGILLLEKYVPIGTVTRASCLEGEKIACVLWCAVYMEFFSDVRVGISSGAVQTHKHILNHVLLCT